MFYKLLIAVLSWLALIGQFYLILENRVTTVGETVIRYFSFFTILTNLLVALCFTSLAFSREKKSWFSKSRVITAVTVYILGVGLVYNVVLRFLWKPEGLQWIVDELLHSVIPLLCVVYWWLRVPARDLKWGNAFPWLIYPLVYILLVLARGSVSGFYPYPFIDVSKIGYHQVWIHSGWLTGVFLGFSLAFIAAGKWKRQGGN